MNFQSPPNLAERLDDLHRRTNDAPLTAPDADDPITATQFKEGDRLTFHDDIGNPLYLMVEHMDEKFAYLRRQFHQSTNEYRVSLRSTELRFFDQLGWTLIKGRFTHILSGFRSSL